MIVGCQNTTEKIVVENKVSPELSRKNNTSSYNKNFTKNKIIKSEITLNVKKLEPKKMKMMLFLNLEMKDYFKEETS